jgi:hypothetical protein
VTDPSARREVIARIVVAVLLAALVAWSFARRWAILDATPFPTGIDGYFYPVQLRSLLGDGTLQYPASPLTFWFMAPFAAATDPITGAKLGAALGGALIALPAYGVGARLGRGRGAGLIAAVLATTSAGSLYLSIEFVKNGIGLTVAMTALWLVLRACDVPTRGRIAAAVAGILAAILAHKMAAGIVIALAIPAAVAEAAGRSALRGRRLLYVLGGLALIAVIALVVGAVAPQRLLGPADAALLAKMFTSQARWSAPALAFKHVELAMGNEALLGALFGLVAIAVHTELWRKVVGRVRLDRERDRPGAVAIGWGVIALAVVIGTPWLDVGDPQGLGFRLRIAAFVPMALCAAIVAGRLFAYLPFEQLTAKLPLRDLALAVAAAVLVDRGASAITFPGAQQIEGEIVVHPALVTSSLALRSRIPPGATAIVPERHLAFMVAWYASAHVSIRPEPVPEDQRVRILPGNWVELDSPLDQALLEARAHPEVPPPIGGHPRHPDGFVLVPEATWSWVLDRLPADARRRWGAWPTK